MVHPPPTPPRGSFRLSVGPSRVEEGRNERSSVTEGVRAAAALQRAVALEGPFTTHIVTVVSPISLPLLSEALPSAQHRELSCSMPQTSVFRPVDSGGHPPGRSPGFASC